MRKERENNPSLTHEQKEAIRWAQIDACEKRAQQLNFDLLSDETIRAYQRILSEKNLGTDICSPSFKRGNEDLFVKSAPVLVTGLTAGYLRRVFDKLRFHVSLDESKTSFSLLDITGSPDGHSVDENRGFAEPFQEYEEAWQLVENWTPFDGARVFLDSIQSDHKVLLPNIRRDLAAMAGELTDLPHSIGGARSSIPTQIFGVQLDSDYSCGTTEFPHVEVVVLKLR